MKSRLLLIVIPALLFGCGDNGDSSDETHANEASQLSASVGAPESRQAFFGELHIHTGYSYDAWTLVGTRTTPDYAYKFARGETVEYLGKPVQRPWPLDFMAVTDHSEYLGVLNNLENPESAFAQSDLGKRILESTGAGRFKILRGNIDDNISPDELGVRDEMVSAWEREIAAANTNYQPGTFTTLIAYEWTSMDADSANFHRNVIFAGDTAPMPFTSADSKHPEDLWAYMDKVRAGGIDVLAIPHNSNVSNGLMFDWNDSRGKPIDEAYAQQRAINEPLIEIYQNKGQSETLPSISPTDEFANFEIFDEILSMKGASGTKSKVDGGYVRQAYGRGLAIKQRVGTDPFKAGVVAATDFHNSLATSEEDGHRGNGGVVPETPLPDLAAAKGVLGLEGGSGRDMRVFGAAGLTGAWAEENTRESIFATLKRKETYGTSGPRLRLRVFGAWAFSEDLFAQEDWVKTSYAQGVPMGGDLPARPETGARPSFVIEAVKAPDSGNLDRVQVIKVWLDGDKPQEKIFDVALSDGRQVDPESGKAPPVGNTVNIKAGTYTNDIGAVQLRTIWADPEFDATQPAVYYVRILEIPTPRWTTILAARTGLPAPTENAIIQERAWSSPIWYTP